MTRRDCDHIGILTADAEALIRFYCDLLGYRTVRDEVVAGGLMRAIFGVDADCRLVKLSPPQEAEGVNIEIFAYSDGITDRRLPRAPGFNHWGMRVHSREAFVAAMRSRGAAVTEVQRDGHAVYFIADPDGNRIEIRD